MKKSILPTIKTPGYHSLSETASQPAWGSHTEGKLNYCILINLPEANQGSILSIPKEGEEGRSEGTVEGGLCGLWEKEGELFVTRQMHWK